MHTLLNLTDYFKLGKKYIHICIRLLYSSYLGDNFLSAVQDLKKITLCLISKLILIFLDFSTLTMFIILVTILNTLDLYIFCALVLKS